MKQSEAVYNAVKSVCEENNVEFHDGIDAKAVLTKEMRSQVNTILFEGFKSGTIALDKEMSDTELKGYVSGLQSNWLRKDKRLNGNTKYAPKNPGSRFGASDEQLKALRALMANVTSDAERAEIQGYIDERTAAIRASKAPKVDISSLPEALHKYVK
jgi:hypothetical protein